MSGWEWVTDHRWTVVRDATCDEEGWTYASDWPRITAPRAGGRKSQRAKDMVRRRRTRSCSAYEPASKEGHACRNGYESSSGLLRRVRPFLSLRGAEDAEEGGR